MSISRFNSETPLTELQLFYEFLNENKTGTFLDNVNIALNPVSSSSNILTISTDNATFSITTGNIIQGGTAIEFRAIITSILGAKDQADAWIAVKGALLCNNGLIIDIDSDYNGAHYSPEIALTVDSSGELAVIFKNAATILPSGSGAVPSISGYRVNDTNSSSEATVTLTPQYGAMKTSLAPIVPLCTDNSILLPYTYAALHTQASGVGLQSMTMDGNNYITNGCWYIKD